MPKILRKKHFKLPILSSKKPGALVITELWPNAFSVNMPLITANEF